MVRILILLIFIGLATTVYGQECTGNLGENIFEEGDFGAGVNNILQTDPQLAPGYNYTTSPPPNDGFYTITNNTTPWGSFASVWIDIKDNSSDPNGYMMVVNASFETGLFYRQRIDGLCENSLYEFSCDVINLIAGRDEIKPNVSFLIDGAVVYETGDIPENGQWATYRTTFTTAPGQNSVLLGLRNNALGGLGNDLALDNISFRACGPGLSIDPNEEIKACANGTGFVLEANINGDQFTNPSIQWQQSFDAGNTWANIPGASSLNFTHTGDQVGLYYYRYLLANGNVNILNPFCRVASEAKIVEVIQNTFPIRDTICAGSTYDLGGELLTATGNYQDTLLSSIGCDSIVALALFVVEDNRIDANFNTMNPTCVENEDGSIAIENIFNGNAPYQVIANGMPSDENGILEMIGAGTYVYSIEDRFGCRLDTLLELVEPAIFSIDLGEDIRVELGESITIEPSFSELATDYIWVYKDSIICDTFCESLSFLPNGNGILSLSAKANSSGCVADDDLKIRITEVRKVYIPNTFSPNGDGINDVFTIHGSEPNISIIESFRVFNRWGALVFEKKNFKPNDDSFAWDGTFKGSTLVDGVYIYTAQIRFLDNEVLGYSGDITLLR